MVMVHRIFVRSQQISCDIHNSVCRGEKWPTKDRLQLFYNKALLNVINALNNETTIQLNLAEYHLILANSVNGLVGQVSGVIPHDFAG